jgi:MYXO-CTERM domain-containing protein
VAPVVDLNSKPASTVASHPAPRADETVPIAGGAIALLALGGAAVAVSRRRRRVDEETWHGDWADEPESADDEAVAATPATAEAHREPMVHDEQPEVVAPSAFSWGPRPEPTAGERDSDDDRLPGETWVERAYRGPSANNPSVSLKNRLRRAAFFDKRERDVAAGLAEPVDPDAGLPDAMTEQDKREFA